MSKKIKIILIAVVVLGVMILGYYLFNKNKTSTTDGTPSLLQKFNPFGTSTKVDNTTGDNQTGDSNSNTSQVNSRLHQITDFSVAGDAFFEDTRPIQASGDSEGDTVSQPNTFETVEAIRYVERATGHIYEKYLDNGVIGKISNSTIPAVHEAIFDSKANSVIYRYVATDNKTITSFLASLGGESSFLNSDILEVSLSPDKNKFFSIIKSSDGVVGTIKSFDETKTSQVFTSPFSEWLPQWATEQNIFLTTKPSYLVDGNVFSLNIGTGTLTKIFGDIPGLTTLGNNDGKYILYGASLNNGPKLNIFDIKNHTSIDLNTYGLPEKCVWSSDNVTVYCAVPNTIVGNEYPDSWYQGLVSFDDFFVKINTSTGSKSTLANSKDETVVDATNLSLSIKEDKLFFINKKDGTLWQLDI